MYQLAEKVIRTLTCLFLMLAYLCLKVLFFFSRRDLDYDDCIAKQLNNCAKHSILDLRF
jgi:hypothetical protein